MYLLLRQKTTTLTVQSLRTVNTDDTKLQPHFRPLKGRTINHFDLLYRVPLPGEFRNSTKLIT